VIRLRNVSKKIEINKKKYIEVLSNITLDIEPGEITGLIGVNGAGKTTLIKLISELYKPSNGTIEYDFDLNRFSRKSSILSSTQGLYKNFTVKNIISYFGYLQSDSFNFYSNDVASLIEILCLKSVLEKNINELSSGTHQKLLVLLAFINDPAIVLLDEPTYYLDFIGKIQLEEIILSRKDNKYILYTSHNFKDIEKICTKCALLHEGKLLLYDKLINIYQTNKSRNLEKIICKKIQNSS